MATPAHRAFIDPDVIARLSRLAFESRNPMVGTITGFHKSPHRGASVEFAEYRKYVPGDDVRHVDWRVYARTDRFYMKEFEADTNLRCYIALDCSRSMGFEDAHGVRLDYARRLAATLAYLLVHQGDAVGLCCIGDRVLQDIPPRHHPAHLRHIFDALAAVEPEGGTDLATGLHALAERIRRRAVVIVLSDLLTDEAPLLSCFRHILHRKHDLSVFHLMDPVEMQFPFDRPMRFLDMEDGQGTITDPVMVRESYTAAVHEAIASLRTGCRELGVDYRHVVTDVPYDEVLATYLLQRRTAVARA